MRITVVGLGPGDPELLTVKGVRVIEAADLVFVPRSRGGQESLALQIARPWLALDRQRVVELALPMTRDESQLLPAWRSAADQIALSLAERAAATGRSDVCAVYLLLGDPLLYGTFTYIWHELALHHTHIEVDVVPGVTSFAAAAARVPLVLATSADRVAVLPASHETDAGQLRRLLADFETVVLMKVGGVLDQVLAALADLRMLDNAVYAERVGMPDEVIVRDVRTLQGATRPYLSLLIVTRGAGAKGMTS